VVPAVIVVEVDGKTAAVVPAYVTPPYVIEQELAAVFDVPELIMERLQTSLWVFQTHVVTLAETCAVLVNVPNRPKTKPAIAIAAMRVMAISMTVARTGEIAFLLPVLVGIFNLFHYSMGTFQRRRQCHRLTETLHQRTLHQRLPLRNHSTQ